MRVERIGSRVERGFGRQIRRAKETTRYDPIIDLSPLPLTLSRSLAPESPGPGTTRHSLAPSSRLPRTYISPAHRASHHTHSRRFLDPVARLHGPCCAPAALASVPTSLPHRHQP